MTALSRMIWFGWGSNRNLSPTESLFSCLKIWLHQFCKKLMDIFYQAMMAFLKQKKNSYSYYWPGMDKDISNHIDHCHKYQLRRKAAPPGQVLVTPLPQTTEWNQRVHADLFGPLKASGSPKKYVLCITIAFTKYVKLVAIPNKETPTVAQAIFERWLCHFGMPLKLATDQGKELCSELSEDLFHHMQVLHLKTMVKLR